MKFIEQKCNAEKTTAGFWNTKKTVFFHSKTQSHVIQAWLKFALIPIVRKTGFASQTKHGVEATQGFTSVMRDNI